MTDTGFGKGAKVSFIGLEDPSPETMRQEFVQAVIKATKNLTECKSFFLVTIGPKGNMIVNCVADEQEIITMSNAFIRVNRICIEKMKKLDEGNATEPL